MSGCGFKTKKDPLSKSGIMKIYQFSCETYLNIMGVKGKKTYTSDYKQDEKSRSPGLGE